MEKLCISMTSWPSSTQCYQSFTDPVSIPRAAHAHNLIGKITLLRKTFGFLRPIPSNGDKSLYFKVQDNALRMGATVTYNLDNHGSVYGVTVVPLDDALSLSRLEVWDGRNRFKSNRQICICWRSGYTHWHIPSNALASISLIWAMIGLSIFSLIGLATWRSRAYKTQYVTQRCWRLQATKICATLKVACAQRLMLPKSCDFVFGKKFFCHMWGSNPRPRAHKTRALTTELMWHRLPKCSKSWFCTSCHVEVTNLERLERLCLKKTMKTFLGYKNTTKLGSDAWVRSTFQLQKKIYCL